MFMIHAYSSLSNCFSFIFVSQESPHIEDLPKYGTICHIATLFHINTLSYIQYIHSNVLIYLFCLQYAATLTVDSDLL